MKIMTGKNGAPHVTSQQFRQLVEGTVGQDSYILTSGENLEPELQTNNLLKIRSGMMSHHGNLSVVEIGTYDEVTIQNGTQGMQRIDLVVNRYTRNEETGIESSDWVVIQGMPAAESPAVPEYTEGNLQEGDLVDDCPVFEVHLNGINVTEVVKLLDVVPNISELNSKLEDTGWLEIIGTPLAVNIKAPTAGTPVKYRKINGMVYVSGTFGIVNAPLSTNYTLFTFPEECSPDFSGYYYVTNTATGERVARYLVNAAEVRLEWIRSIIDGSQSTGEILWAGIDFSFPAKA